MTQLEMLTEIINNFVGLGVDEEALEMYKKDKDLTKFYTDLFDFADLIVEDNEKETISIPTAWEEMWDFLLDNEICSEDFVRGAVAMTGRNKETMKNVLFYWTGYRDFAQYIEDEMA